MQDLAHDLRLALRTLRRSPGFAAVAILTLAAGIGATATIFSAVDGVLLRPLPFPEPASLVTLLGYDRATGDGRWSSSYPDFADFREQCHSFSEMGAYWVQPSNLTGSEGDPQRLPIAAASHDLLPMLGLHPVLGRGFAPGDDRRGAAPVALLSHEIWATRFGAAADVLERSVILDGVAHDIVGVLPPRTSSMMRVEIFVPLEPREATEHRGVHNLQVMARLAPGVALEQATADVETVAERLSGLYPGENAQRAARLEPLHEAVVGRVRTRLLVLFGAVGFVLLIACVNVSNLLLSRATARTREIATRNALGASRWQLGRQLLCESLLLALGGAVVGLAGAVAGTRLLVARMGDEIPRLADAAVDLRVVGFTVAVALGTGVVFGLAPIFESFRSDLFAALRDGFRLDGGGRRRGRRLLVVAEVTLAVILLTGAGLLLRSFERLSAVDPGFRAAGLLAVDLELPGNFVTEEWNPRVQFFAELERRLAALPGVEAVSSAYQTPADPGWSTSFRLAAAPEPAEGYEPEANFRPVTPGYFRAMGIPLLRGRAFDDRDGATSPSVAVVNRAFVRTFLPDVEPVGRTVLKQCWWDHDRTEWEIVGVVDDVRFAGLAVPAEPAIYYLHAQNPVPAMTVLLRVRGNPLAVVPSVREEVRRLDPELPLGTVATLEDELAASVGNERFLTELLGGFALVALLLAALGIYGVLAFNVSRRTRELGIRMALGAARSDVLVLVLGQGLALTLAGVAAGLGGAAALSHLLRSLLFEISATDPGTFVLAGGFLTTVALAASLVPARRATRVDPIVALRCE